MNARLSIAACAAAFSLALPGSAGAVVVGFGGVIDFNGAFPPAPDPVGQPVSGTVTFASPLSPTVVGLTTTTYTDPTGDLKIDFGAGGAFTSFDGNTPLAISVSDIGGNTVLRFEAWNGGSPGVGDKGIVLFTAPGLNAFGPDRALPTSAFTFADLLATAPGSGSITIAGGLTSFDVTTVTPEPALTLCLPLIAAVATRRRR